MLWLLVVLVLILFGAAVFVTDVPRGEVAFRHLGIADAMSRNVAIDPNIDAYFNWPGFFALLATVLGTAGLDPVSVALWAPVFNVGLWLVAVAVVTRYLISDPRRRWLVLWLFCLGNWQDQDYLSPRPSASSSTWLWWPWHWGRWQRSLPTSAGSGAPTWQHGGGAGPRPNPIRGAGLAPWR
ncbi:hypothetical protein OUO20_17170 [Arthrobacter sp. FX8]|uniref:hypothetical protein n=1 Tax=Arthrobacter sp. FX8 TaxID=2997335 RepID=UPI00227BC12A|nr:hypothetical protein [Arthrobacter sp. FX8]WAJ32799.1 hypothetical protein OUO20_17170 [Arthrobacter sp. FX8]